MIVSKTTPLEDLISTISIVLLVLVKKYLADNKTVFESERKTSRIRWRKKFRRVTRTDFKGRKRMERKAIKIFTARSSIEAEMIMTTSAEPRKTSAVLKEISFILRTIISRVF